MSELKLLNKVAIITGANRGLGFEISKHFIQEGANLIICARNSKLLKESVQKLYSYSKNNEKIISLAGDISNQNFSEEIIRKGISTFKNIDILVNNAGIYGPMGKSEDVDWEKWKRSIEINLFGSVLMSRSVLKHFKDNKYGKIIQISGGGATSPLPMISSYAASKAAIVRYMETLSEENNSFGIDINCIAPGAMKTQMLEEVLKNGAQKIGKEFHAKMLKINEEGGTPFEMATSLSVFLASSESDGISGKLISAVWDNWHKFKSNKKLLKEKDIFTLRRIAGRDRSISWADK